MYIPSIQAASQAEQAYLGDCCPGWPESVDSIGSIIGLAGVLGKEGHFSASSMFDKCHVMSAYILSVGTYEHDVGLIAAQSMIMLNWQLPSS
jgi:hypothetical protein